MPHPARRRNQKTGRPPADAKPQPAPGSAGKGFPLRQIIAAALAVFLISGIALFCSATAVADPAAVLPPNTLVEFADFQCPYCARFALEVYPQVHQDYIDAGRLNYQFKHYPFLGQESWKAALAAECAREQNAFQAMHDAIFLQAVEVQPTLSLADLGTALVAEPDQFRECLEQQRHEAAIEQDKRLGQDLGIKGTPTLFLNGEQIPQRAISSYPRLQAEIERLLATP